MSPHFSAMVVRPQLTWFASPADPDRPTHGQTPGWAAEPGSLGRIIDLAGGWFKSHGEGVVLIQLPEHRDMTPRARKALGERMIKSIKSKGWETSSQGIDTGWFLCLRDGSPAVMLGVSPWIDQSRTTLFSLERAEPAPAIARRLALYQRHVGVAWRGTGGLSGCALLRNLRQRNQPRWRWDTAPTQVVGSSFELGRRLTRQPTDTERSWGLVHKYDVRGMYLAAALNAELALDALEPRGAQEFDPTRPGYWLVDPTGLFGAGTTLTRPAPADGRDLQWVTTPIMALWAEQGGVPEVHDSWTGDRQSRIMRPWAERLRTARDDVPEEIKPAVKDTYARTVGMLRKVGGRVYRPDWRDTIVDLAKVNLLRKLLADRQVPLRYETDAVWIASADARPGFVIPDHGRIGGLRFEHTQGIDEYLAEMETV